MGGYDYYGPGLLVCNSFFIKVLNHYERVAVSKLLIIRPCTSKKGVDRVVFILI